MSFKEGIEELNKKIDKYTQKLRKAFRDGSSIRRRTNLRARLDNLCEERDFYKKKLREKEGE